MQEGRIQWRQISSLLQLCCGLLCLTGRVAPVLADESVQKGNASSEQRLQQADNAKFDQLTKNNAVHNQKVSDANGRTALMYAARAGNMEAVHKLISWDGREWVLNHLADSNTPRLNEYIDRCDHDSYTALMYACAGKSNPEQRVTIVNYLLNAKADPAIQCGYGQFTALQLAQNAGNTVIADAIERNLDARNAKEAKTKAEAEAEKAEAKTKNEQSKWYNQWVTKTLVTMSSILGIVANSILLGLVYRLKGMTIGSRTAKRIKEQITPHLNKQADYNKLSYFRRHFCLRAVVSRLSTTLGDTTDKNPPSEAQIDDALSIVKNLKAASTGGKK